MMVRFAFLLILLASPALAAPPAGVDLGSAEHAWWDCLSNSTPPGRSVICCDVADGHLLRDGDWRIKDGAYEIRVRGAWWPVPPSAVITAGKCGIEPKAESRAEAKVWYGMEWAAPNLLVGLYVHCFLPGTEF